MLFKSYEHFHKLTMDGRTDGGTYIVIIVQTCWSCNLKYKINARLLLILNFKDMTLEDTFKEI